MKNESLVNLCCAIFYIFELSLAQKSASNASPRLFRKRRNLISPEGSEIQFIFGFGLPASVQQQSLTMGITLKFNYAMPGNSTVFTDPYSIFQKRSVDSGATRWDLYSAMEATSDRLGLDGRACILRTICEAADTTLQYNGLVGEVLHVLLTPSTTSEACRSYMDSEYHAAERLGTEVSGSCHRLYSECQVGLLDFISTLEEFIP